MTKSSQRSIEASVGRRSFMQLAGGATLLSVLGARSGHASGQTASADASVPPWNKLPRSPVRPISIDVHTHWSPPAYTTALVELGRVGTGKPPEPLKVQLAARVKKMDERGVQVNILTLSGRMPWPWLKPEDGARLAALVNDAGLEAHTMFPDRFFYGAAVPARDPDLAVKELDRIAGRPGLKGVCLPPSIEAKDYIFDPSYGPFLARCEQLGLPLLFHPLDEDVNYYGGTDTRVGEPLNAATDIYNRLGFPMDTGTTATMFVVTGTLDKYPKLEVVLPHAGGSFPYIAGRVDHGMTRRKFKLPRPFRDYVRRFYYDTIIYYPETLRFMVAIVGVDRLMIGSDNGYGANLAIEWPNSLVEQLNLPEADEERILRGNAQRLFKL